MIDTISTGFILLYFMLSPILKDVMEYDVPKGVEIATGALLDKEGITDVTVNSGLTLEESATTDSTHSTGFLLDDGLQSNFSENEIALRSFVTKQSWLWPRGVVPYVIDSHFDWWQREKIGKAFKFFHHVSCVRFVPRTNQKDFLFFEWQPDARCTSFLGRMGDGMQPIALKDECINNPLYKGLLLHEIMHALGFIHEHQRNDRDCYLHVSGPLSEGPDFEIIEYTDTRFPYDYRSIMHYRPRDWFYAKNGEEIGNRAGTLTKLDKEKLNYLYCGGPHYCDLNPRQCRATEMKERTCRAPVDYNRYD